MHFLFPARDGNGQLPAQSPTTIPHYSSSDFAFLRSGFMAGVCCRVNIGETEPSSPTDPRSRSARRRKMGIRRFNFPPTESAEGGVRRTKRKLDAAVPGHVARKENYQVSGEIASESPSPPGEASEFPKFGFTSVRGRRRDMEDEVAIHPSLCGRNHNFFGVYDGHGCSHVATKCRDRMHEIVKEEIQNGGSDSLEQKMFRSFSRMDKEAGECSGIVKVACRCELQTPQCDAVGSTAVVAVVSPEKIVVSNCGDSRAVLCRNGVAIPLSIDHKPDRPDELNRIEDAGGRVIFWDCPRVLGVLAMSRAIGDSYLKPYVIAEPEVTITERADGDECLILASDGLWDVVSNETACSVARMCLQSRRESSDGACSDASILLTKLALARHSSDNVSVVVVDLRT